MQCIQLDANRDLVRALDNTAKEELLEQMLVHYSNIKSGLVWTSNSETEEFFTPDAISSVPVLERWEHLDVNSGAHMPPNHLIIGDNYHTACVLQDMYRGHIGLIYCDVPYNTGKDFKYNDKFVDVADKWRHSKWLCFIEKRFRLMKRLLRPDGVFAVSIADNELANLTLLMDELFGQNNRITCSPVIVNPGGKKGASISTQHEYLLVYSNNAEKALERLGKSPFDFIDDSEEGAGVGLSKSKTFILPEVTSYKVSDTVTTTGESDRPYCDKNGPFDIRLLMKNGSESLRSDRPQMFYPIYYVPPIYEDDLLVIKAPGTGRGKKSGGVLLDTQPRLSLTKPEEYSFEILPLDRKTGVERRWRWGAATTQQEIDKGEDCELVVKIDSTVMVDGLPVVQIYTKGREKLLTRNPQMGVALRAKTLQSVLSKPGYATQAGTKRLEELFGVKNIFDYPKPPALIEDIILAFSAPDDIVADFFAGSGTTGEAVMNVNKKYGRNNRFILATNNENQIGEEITRERIAMLNEGKFRGAAKDEPSPVKLLVYGLKLVDVSEWAEGNGVKQTELNQPEIIQAIEDSSVAYNTVVYGADRVIYDDGNLSIQVNTFDKILVITEKGRSGIPGAYIRDYELYERIEEYTRDIEPDYKRVLIQYSLDETPKGVDDIVEQGGVYAFTQPVRYLQSIQYAVSITRQHWGSEIGIFFRKLGLI